MDSALRLLETEQPKEEPKPLSKVRQELVLDYYATYLNEMGEKCPETFVKCLGSLRSIFEGKDDDEIIICYPSRQEWNEELRKFFYKSKENWYRLNNRITFHTFCKNYGRYNHHVPKQQTPVAPKVTYQVKETAILIRCTKCNKNFKANEYHNCGE